MTPILLSLFAALAAAQTLTLGRVVDLTHPVDARVLSGLERHEGTHVDAPPGKTIEDLPIERMISRFVVIDVSRWAARNRSYQARVSDFADWEKYHGRIPERAVVLIRTGYSKHWGNREKYLGTSRRGADSANSLRFPGLHPTAADWLVERGVAGVGIDTARLDHGLSRDFAARKIFAEAGLPIYENLDNLEALPETGGWLLAFPMRVAGAQSVPIRVLAALGS